MSAVALRVLAGSTRNSFAELRAWFTWRTWVFGWLLRLLAQTLFYGLMGKLVHSDEQMQYVVIGNAVAVTVIEASLVILSVCEERTTGTLPLVAAAPGSVVAVYVGRGLQWLCTGFASSAAAFLLVPLVLGVAPDYPRALLYFPLVAVIGLSAYCYGCFLAGIAVRARRWQWLLLNLSYLVPMAVCGVNTPVGYWPRPVQWLAQILPPTHGLAAVRAALDGGGAVEILGHLALEAAVGAGWFCLMLLSFRRLVSSGRKDGSIVGE
jgi:ABC-2 type transport system permease protein